MLNIIITYLYPCLSFFRKLICFGMACRLKLEPRIFNLNWFLQIVGKGTADSRVGIVAQLIWREFFYTMSAQNANYGKIQDNPICLPIPWYDNPEHERKVEMVSISINSHQCWGAYWSFGNSDEIMFLTAKKLNFAKF